jgi:trimeric autotransporter adhesin
MKNTLAILFLVFTSYQLYAGGCTSPTLNPSSPPPSCADNPPAGNTCQTATPICDLNGYCGSTSSSYTSNSWSQLNNSISWSLENNSFLTFVASSNILDFNVWITYSECGDGIQILVFQSAGDCSGAITKFLDWSPGNASAGPLNLQATGLTPGQTYYIMIDGFAGDVNDYVIGINSGAEIPVNVESSVQGDNICLGETITLTAEGGNGSYVWDPVPGLSSTSNQVVSITPTTIGTYTFTVNSATGNEDCPSSNVATTIIEVINCSCTIEASNTGDVCLGETSSIASTSVPDVISYAWTGPNGYSSSTLNPGTITPPQTPGSYDYTITATVIGGTCSSTTTIVVKPSPTVDLPPTLSACNGEVIPETILQSDPSNATFTWTNSNISIGLGANGTGNIPEFIASNPSNSVVTANVSVVPTLDGCIGSADVVAISITPTPTVNVISDITVCVGQTVSIPAFTSPQSGVTYAWSNNNTNTGLGASGNGNISSFTSTNNGLNPLTSSVTVTPSIGTCVGTPSNFNIVVNPLPVVNAGADATICAGESVTLTAAGASTYSWNNSVTNGTPFTPTSTTTYTVTGTDANGCQNIDQVVVTVNALPNVNAGPDVAVCAGESVTLTGAGATSYDWNNGITNGTPFTPTVTTTYTVTGTGANGCIGTDQVVVTVNPIPTINAGADVTICAGSSVVLNASGGATYVWSSGTSNGGSVSPETTTTYTVTGTTAAGCSNTDEITVTVLPVPNSSFDADAITGYPVHTVNFTNNSTNANNYTWSFGNGITIPSNTTDDQTTSYSETGTYTVILFASNGVCSDSSSIQIIVLPFPDAIIYIPNVFTPNGDNSNDFWFIDAKFASTLNVQVFNRWGNMMLEMDEITDKWDGKVDGKDATAGVYFYKYIATDLNGKEYTGHGNFTLIR